MKIYQLINLLEDIELRRVFRHLKKLSTIIEEANLTEEEKKHSQEYWRKYGVNLDAIDFKNIAAYKLCQNIYKPSYFPSYFFYTYIKTYLNDQNAALFLGNKALSKGLLPDLNHPHSQAFRVCDSPLLDANYNPITWNDFVASIDDKAAYLFKPGLGTTSCKGIKVFTKSDAASVKEDIEKTSSFVVQRYLKESKIFAPFKSSSLATIRIYTLNYGERPEVTASCLRIEQTNKMILSLEGELYIPINREGVLLDVGFNNNLDRITTKDEINGFKFGGFKILAYQKIVDAALKAALRYKQIRFIGWDFAVGENDEPVFIECNLEQSGAGLLQVCAHGDEPFGKHTDDILRHAFRHHRR